jgi:signal transduction histidine kinase
MLTSLIALTLLWRRLSSIFDLWLLVAMCALLVELVIVTMLMTSRFSVGFYSSGVLSVIVSTCVLVALLVEAGRLHHTLQRDSRSGVADLQTVVAAIAAEMRQPLTGIVTRGTAARRYLERSPPDVDKVKSLLDEIVHASFQADEVIESNRALFIDRAGDRKT